MTVSSLDLNSIQIHLYSNASFINLHGGGSQSDYIVFICDKEKLSTDSMELHMIKELHDQR